MSFLCCLWIALAATHCGADSELSCGGADCEASVLEAYAEDHVASIDAGTSGSEVSVELLQHRATEFATFLENSSGPDEESSCDAFDKLHPRLVKVDFAMSDVVVNNLGGVGPQKGASKELFYRNVAKVGAEGEVLDMRVTVIGDNYPVGTAKNNGENGHYGVINLKCGGEVNLQFDFVDKQGNAKNVEDFIFSWFDLDSGKQGFGHEKIILWPGFASTVVAPGSEIIASEVPCPDDADATLCKSFSSSTAGTGKDNPRNPMTLTAQQAARTFSAFYKGKSSFRVTLVTTEGYGSRNFLFTGMSQVAYSNVEECCPDHICACKDFCVNDDTKTWGEKCEWSSCVACDKCKTTTTTTTQEPASKDETCEEAVTFELTNLAKNTLGDGQKGELLFKNVVEHGGRSLDLTVTDASLTGDHKALGLTKYTADKQGKTGTYKEAARIDFDEAGKYMFRFKFKESDTGKDATLPLFPLTFYDVDGVGEMLTACNLAGVITHFNTGLKERQSGQCYHHLATKREVYIPEDFEHLHLNQAKQSVSYVYRNTGEWDIAVTLGEDEKDRHILFKSSKVLACDGVKKPPQEGEWKKNGRQGDH